MTLVIKRTARSDFAQAGIYKKKNAKSILTYGVQQLSTYNKKKKHKNIFYY